MKRKLFTTFILVVTLLGSVFAQQRTVTGTVTSASDKLSMPGATVVVKEAGNIGTITDVNGKYSVNVPKGSNTLVFSFIGMETKSVKIGTSNVINVTLQMTTKNLDDVVVTALGIKREVKALGFAAQKIGEDDLSAARDPSISNYLTGKIAGVQVAKTASGSGGSTKVLIRGAKSFSSDSQPLYVVDGMPINNYSNNNQYTAVAEADADYGDGIGSFNPSDVESINVLKGPAATALYGMRGSNGVIVITTKSGKSANKGIGIEVNSGVTLESLYLIPNFQNKFGSGYGDNSYADQGWSTTINGVDYLWPDNGQLDSWGGPLNGKRMIPNWWTLPSPLTSSSIWDCPINNVIPYVAQPADNVRKFFKTGVTYSNDVAVTSSNDKSSMRLSVGEIKIEGVVPNSEIINKSVNFNGSTKVNDILSFEGKINYLRTDGDQRPLTGYSQSNPMWNLIDMPRDTPLDFVKKQYELTHTNIRYPGINYNPYYMVDQIKNHDFMDRIVGGASATLKFNSWLSLMGRVGVDFSSQYKQNTWPEDPSSKNIPTRLGEMIQTINRVRDLNADVMLTANKKVSANLSLNGTLGANVHNYRSDSMTDTGMGFKAVGVYDMSNFTNVQDNTSLYQKESQSVYFTGEAAYKNFLFVDVTGRNDWSSALGVKDYSFFYPSVSTGFVFTDAANINKDILSYGKVRASWAQAGSDAGAYQTLAGYSLSTGETWNGNSFAYMSGTLPLFDLKNELTESVEFGADLRFLENRINLDVTYYNGTTKNQIINVGVSNASGYGSQIMNAGEVRNSGIEATIGITPVKTKDFGWDINFNYAANHSKVVTLDGKLQTYPLIASSAGEPGLANIEARVGQAYGNIVGYAYQRAPDGQKIVDGSGSYVAATKVSTLGNITPRWIGGLNNTFSYKGFRLNILLDFKEGGQIVSATKYEMTRTGTGQWTLPGRRPQEMYEQGDVIPAGKQVGDQMPYTGILAGVVATTDANGVVTYVKNTQAVPGMIYWGNRGWRGISEEFVENGSYISLREVMLSYSLKASLLKKTPFTGVTLSAYGRNLLYLQNGMAYIGVSPESAPNTAGGAAGMESLTIPSTSSYGFNVKVTF